MAETPPIPRGDASQDEVATTRWGECEVTLTMSLSDVDDMNEVARRFLRIVRHAPTAGTPLWLHVTPIDGQDTTTVEVTADQQRADVAEDETGR